jgi:RNA polymerase sigma-70 factor (ECF subfamily)
VLPNAEYTPGAPIGFGAALERVMARFDSAFRVVARTRGLAPDDIDEVLQDVRIRLWKSQPTSEKLDGLGASYLMRVVSTAIIDRLRQQKRRQETSLDGADAEVVPEALQVAQPDRAAQTEIAARLNDALMQLPQNRRVVVQLHLEGYERSEISGMTGWSEAKVRNLLYRGLEDLRAALRAHGQAANTMSRGDRP